MLPSCPDEPKPTITYEVSLKLRQERSGALEPSYEFSTMRIAPWHRTFSVLQGTGFTAVTSKRAVPIRSMQRRRAMSSEVEHELRETPPPGKLPPPPEKPKEITINMFVVILFGPAAVFFVVWILFEIFNTGDSDNLLVGLTVLGWLALAIGGFTLFGLGIIRSVASALRRNENGRMLPEFARSVVGAVMFFSALLALPFLIFQGDDYVSVEHGVSSEVFNGTVVLSEDQWRVDFDVSAHEANGVPIDLSTVTVIAQSDDPGVGNIMVGSEGRSGTGTIFIFSSSIESGSADVRWSMWVEGAFDGPPVLVVEPAPPSDE